jgi:membrane fusion protein, multidrug efflux system
VLARIQAEGIRSQAAGAASGVAAAQAGVALARRQFESAKSLYDAGAMAELDYRAAQTQLQAAQAQLAAARAQSAGASEAAARTAVRAPIAGQVSDKAVSEGEAVNVGQTLFTVVDSRSLELRGQVPVDQAAQVRAGMPVEFTLDAYPGTVIRGAISRVDPVADPATRQVGVTMRMANPNGELIGGLFAAGRVLTGGSRQVVLVPQAAVRGQGDGAHVWIVQDGRAVRRAVRAGERDEARRMVAIESGLVGGERVIVSPGEVREGAAVRLAETPAEATAAPAAGQEK